MIRVILALLFLAAATAPAETLPEAVASRRPRLQDPDEILHELTAPALVAVTNLVVTAKPEPVVMWEQAVVADLSSMFQLCTNNPSNAVARTRALGSTAAILAAASQAKQVFPDRSAEISRYADRCLAHYVQYLANGGAGMIPADFGQPSTTNTVVTLQPIGQAWWQREGLEQAPAVEQIRTLME